MHLLANIRPIIMAPKRRCRDRRCRGRRCPIPDSWKKLPGLRAISSVPIVQNSAFRVRALFPIY